MSYQITLPAGLELIETWEIPYLLTQAAYPDVPRAGVSCAEILGKSQAGEAAILEFPDSDRALLDRIWQGRENWRAGIPLHVLADYLAAFNDSPERPVWSLRWIASVGKHLEHRVELDVVVRRDIANGTLPVRRKGKLVVIQPEDCMQDVHRHSVVSVEDFILYAKGFLVEVLTEKPGNQRHEGAVKVKAESAQERRERLAARVAFLKASGVSAWLRQIAAEEGRSTSRIKQLLSVGDGTKDAPPVPTGGIVYKMGKR